MGGILVLQGGTPFTRFFRNMWNIVHLLPWNDVVLYGFPVIHVLIRIAEIVLRICRSKDPFMKFDFSIVLLFVYLIVLYKKIWERTRDPHTITFLLLGDNNRYKNLGEAPPRGGYSRLFRPLWNQEVTVPNGNLVGLDMHPFSRTVDGEEISFTLIQPVGDLQSNVLTWRFPRIDFVLIHQDLVQAPTPATAILHGKLRRLRDLARRYTRDSLIILVGTNQAQRNVNVGNNVGPRILRNEGLDAAFYIGAAEYEEVDQNFNPLFQKMLKLHRGLQE